MTLWWLTVPALLLLLVAAARRSRIRRLAAIRAAWGAPIDRERRFEALAASHRSRMSALPGTASLDERTWIDLHLDQVFASLDRTQSTLGQHALYHRLRTAPIAEHLEAFEALVDRMTVDGDARERAQLALGRLQDPHGYDIWWLADPGAVERRPSYAIFPALTAGSVGLAVLAPFSGVAAGVFVGALALNIVIRFATDRHIFTVARSFRQSAPLIATAQSLQFLKGDDIDPIAGPLRRDVPNLSRIKLVARWVNGDPFMLSHASHPLALAFSEVVTVVYEYLNLAFLLDATGVYFALEHLSRHGGSLVRATATAGEIDAAISIASYREGRNDWTRPEFSEAGDAVGWTELRHPLLDDAVPNSIALPTGRGLLVTGSNMSGKSTFLRTAGVNTVLAQTVHTCLARSYRAPIFSVRSCIGRADDLLAGKSYFIAEVEALLELVRASEAQTPHLFLLDELFRGTNAVERIAAGHAVLQQLLGGEHASKPHVVLAATHDRELVDLASDAFEPWHFGDSIGPEGLAFDYRLSRGPATHRNALALLALHGAPEALLAQAMAIAEGLDEQRRTAHT